MFRTILSAAGVAVAVLCSAGLAQAALFSGTYTVNSNSNPGTGLAVVTLNDFGTPVTSTTNSFVNFNIATGALHVGTVQFVDLFELFTPEDPITASDVPPQPISVLFSFTAPSALSGTVSGTTFGVVNLQEGFVHWNNPITLMFGDSTRLQISLLDTEFGSSFNGVVTAQFTAAAPEPGTLALFGTAVMGAFVLRRKRAVKTSAA